MDLFSFGTVVNSGTLPVASTDLAEDDWGGEGGGWGSDSYSYVGEWFGPSEPVSWADSNNVLYDNLDIVYDNVSTAHVTFYNSETNTINTIWSASDTNTGAETYMWHSYLAGDGSTPTNYDGPMMVLTISDEGIDIYQGLQSGEMVRTFHQDIFDADSR